MKEEDPVERKATNNAKVKERLECEENSVSTIGQRCRRSEWNKSEVVQARIKDDSNCERLENIFKNRIQTCSLKERNYSRRIEHLQPSLLLKNGVAHFVQGNNQKRSESNDHEEDESRIFRG